MRITIGGYYGYGSLGDDSVLSCLIKQLKVVYDNCRITVLSSKPMKMAKKYGVRCINRYDPVSIVYELLSSDLYISGGGTLLQDATSKRSLLYYSNLIFLANGLGTPVFAYANGLGPLTNTDIASKALRKCQKVTLRDTASLKFALNDLNCPSASLSPDPFFLTEPLSKKETFDYLRKYGIFTDNYFTVNLRKCHKNAKINTKALLHAIDPFIESGLFPVFISMQDRYDMKLCEKMAAQTRGAALSVPDGETLAGIQKSARFALGMRLHFLLAALISETPTIALSYDPKVENILSSTASLKALNAFSFTPEELILAIKYNVDHPPKIETNSLRSSCLSDINSIGEIAKSKENSKFKSKVKA